MNLCTKAYRHLADINCLVNSDANRHRPSVVAMLFPVSSNGGTSADRRRRVKGVVPEVLDAGQTDIGAVIIARK